MRLFSKRQSDIHSLNAPATFLPEHEKYGESLRNNEMIKDIASKMYSAHFQHLKKATENSYTNKFQVKILFTLSRAGVMFFEDTDGGSIDIAYRDYGYAAVEDHAKRCGIAWILQDIVKRKLKESTPLIKDIQVKLIDRDNMWQTVEMSFDIVMDKYKEL